MPKFFFYFLMTAALLAQSPAGQKDANSADQKAPPAVEQALRERINKFYQLHVDGKFRQVEPLIAEECKDFYYNSNKPRYQSFEINGITWSDNFTKADATVIAKMYIMMPGFGNKPLPVPASSRWKLVNNEWYWYVDMAHVNDSPFGPMKLGTTTVTAPVIPPNEREMAKFAEQVKIDKLAVDLKGNEASSGQFSISNELPGDVKLSVATPDSAGFHAELAKAELKSGEKTTLTVEWKAERPAPYYVQIVLRISPTNQVIPLRVNFIK